MKIERESDNVILVEHKRKRYKYRKTAGGFLPKGKLYNFKVWSCQIGNWLNAEERRELGLPDPADVFARLKADESESL